MAQTASSTLGDYCIAWLQDEAGELLQPQALYHPNQQIRAEAWHFVNSSQREISQWISSKPFKLRKARLYSHISRQDIAHIINPCNHYLLDTPGISSCMIAPLLVDGESIGALALIREKDGQSYSDADFQFFQSLSDRSALAIANVRLVRSLGNSLQQEQALRKQLIQAEKNLALNRMVASVAHEINNPIQTIINCLYILRNALPDDGAEREALNMATSETRRISRLVQQLRDLYRPDTDRALRPLKLQTILDDVHRLIKPHLQHHHIHWEKAEFPEDITINGVSDQIKQVFLNLSLNAVDAMDPEGGTITLGAVIDHATSQVGVSLTDTGPGVMVENIDRIFEPFFTTKSTGTGLGLAITFDIVQRHGGHITVESPPGAGATFTVWLPLA